MSGVVYATTATEYPVTIEQLKLDAHVDGNDEDEALETKVAAATRLAQKKIDRQFCTATMRLTLDEFPCVTRHNPDASIRVPRPPLVSVTVGYVSSDGTTATMPSSDYTVDTASEPGRITPRYGTVWPTARTQPNAVTVTFVAGYGSASAVPDSIKQWILAHAAASYRHRELVSEDEMNTLGFLDSLLDCESYGTV